MLIWTQTPTMSVYHTLGVLATVKSRSQLTGFLFWSARPCFIPLRNLSTPPPKTSRNVPNLNRQGEGVQLGSPPRLWYVKWCIFQAFIQLMLTIIRCCWYFRACSLPPGKSQQSRCRKPLEADPVLSPRPHQEVEHTELGTTSLPAACAGPP